MSASLSVALIAYNEASRLARTLDSVKGLADEIILMDSESTDDTVEIAQSYGAQVIVQPWLGYTAQKNALFEQCHCDFILNLDCDEVLTPALCTEIRQVLSHPKHTGYTLARQTHYLGKLLTHSWHPDRKLRLVKRSAHPKWQGAYVHERLTVQGSEGHLSAPLIHYSYANARQHFEKTVDYAHLAAKAAYEAGRVCHGRHLVLNPMFAFLRMYVFRLGLLDGWRGFAAAKSAAIYTFLKYWFLWEKCHDK